MPSDEIKPQKSVSQAFAELRAVVGDAWDNIDVDKFMHEQRHDEGERDDCLFCLAERTS